VGNITFLGFQLYEKALMISFSVYEEIQGWVDEYKNIN
jgi:hypothetical protein